MLVGLGDTCHQGPPDGHEATEDQHGSQGTPGDRLWAVAGHTVTWLMRYEIPPQWA